MTGADFNAFKAKYGGRINGLVLDNCMKVFFNYPNARSPRLEDTRVETIGSVDYLVIPHEANIHDTKIPDYETFIDLAVVEMIYVTKNEKDRVDQLIM